ncbi:MAG: hypothetical protein ACUVRY_07925 [Thermoanaerobaculaceae bacterium]
MKGGRNLLAPLLFLVLLVAVFYPCFTFQRVLAPQGLLWHVPPWNDLGGPNPVEWPKLLPTALTLAPRLHLIQEHGLRLALWNPFIGNGRVGFFSFAADGYPPLAVLAALAVSSPYHWNALLLMELALAFSGAYLFARQFLSQEAASLTALGYCLSGPVLSQWPNLGGSAAALGPWLWLAVMGTRPLFTAALAALMLVTGGESWPFLLGSGVLAVGTSPKGCRAAAGKKWLLAMLAAGLLAFPSLFLAFFGGEQPGLWWLKTQPKTPASWEMLVRPVQDENGGDAVYLGWPLVLLAVTGISQKGTAKRLALWTLCLALPMVFFLPLRSFPALAGFRPKALLALGVAIAAGLGTEALLGRLSRGWRRQLFPGIAILVSYRLLLFGAEFLPWETTARARLPVPWGQPIWSAQEPLIPLLTLLPPDSGAFLGICDPRGRDLSGEPRYRATLGPAPDGSLHFAKITNPALAELGVSWLLEPEDPQVVRGTLASKVITQQAPREGFSYPLEVPARATRIGLSVASPPFFLRLEQGGETIVLPPDEDFAGAEGWHFWSLPGEISQGPARLLADSSFARNHAKITVAWDVSGWKLVHEGDGFRLWRQRFARPLAAWEDWGATQPAPKVVLWRPGLLRVTTAAQVDGNLVLRLKHRPFLLRVTLDGKEVKTKSAAKVWTAVPVPKGEHVLTAKYALPFWVWLPPVLGVGMFLRKKRVSR